MNQPIFGFERAQCNDCALKGRRDAGLCVPSLPPLEKFGGLMIIGEGPGRTEVTLGRPFVGESGKLLDALLDEAELQRDSIFITNTTLCQPPILSKSEKEASAKQGFHERFPSAIPSCLPRLEAEIAHYRPRVIVTMGTPALIAATGYTRQKARQVENPCVKCENKRKVGPAIQCTNAGCGWTHFFDAPTHEAAKPLHEQLMEALRDPNAGKSKKALCPKCAGRIDRYKIREVSCPDCGGKKKKTETFLEFDYDYTITEVAGTIFEAEKLASRWDELGVKYVIPTYHPSFCLREIDESQTRKALGGQYAALVVIDHLTKARKLLTRDYSFRFNAIMTDRPEDVIEYTQEPGLYSVDDETNAKAAWDVTELRCIGIGRSDREDILVVDTQRLVRNVGTPEHHEFEIVDHELCGALADFLTAPTKPKIGQNFAYDCVVNFRLLGIQTTPIGGDTKALHHVLRPDEPHKLQGIASEMTEAPHWKPPKVRGEQAEYKLADDFPGLAVYNARDVRATALIHEVGAGQFELGEREMPTGVRVKTYTRGGRISTPDLNLRDVYDVDVNVLPIALEMEYYGLPLDIEKMRAMASDLRPKRAALVKDLTGMVNVEGFNLNSTPQLQWVLFHKDGQFQLPASGRTETGQPSTAKEDLAKLAGHPFIDGLLELRELDSNLKVLEGSDMIMREDGCVHPTWNTGGARTGRWTSSPNFQNLQEAIRAIVRAMPGWKIIGADASQLELRIMAALSGDPELIRRCRDADEGRKNDPNCDPHSFVASHVFGDVYWESDEIGRAIFRSICKHVIYGMNYGAGPAKVLETIYKKGYKGPPIGVQQIKNIIEVIFQIFPGVPLWRNQTLACAERDWQVRDPLLGRWRTFPLGKVEATVAWNYPIQSMGAAYFNLRLVALKQRLVAERLVHRFMAQVHDAVYILAREDHAERVAQLTSETLTIPITLVEGAPEMPFVASAKIADDWSMKEAA